jgi:hypothetical protein
MRPTAKDRTRSTTHARRRDDATTHTTDTVGSIYTSNWYTWYTGIPGYIYQVYHTYTSIPGIHFGYILDTFWIHFGYILDTNTFWIYLQN